MPMFATAVEGVVLVGASHFQDKELPVCFKRRLLQSVAPDSDPWSTCIIVSWELEKATLTSYVSPIVMEVTSMPFKETTILSAAAFEDPPWPLPFHFIFGCMNDEVDVSTSK